MSLCQLEQAIQMCNVAVYTAIGKQSVQMQSGIVLLCSFQ